MYSVFTRNAFYRAALVFILFSLMGVFFFSPVDGLPGATAQTSTTVYIPLVGRNSLWETGTLSGKIIDAITKEPVSEAEVCLAQSVCTQTDSDGKYSLVAYPGYWQITVSYDGYYDGSRGGYVAPNTDTMVNVVIVPEIAGENIDLRIVLMWSETPTYTNPIDPYQSFDNDLDAHLWISRPDISFSHHIHYDAPGDCTVYPSACLVSTATQGTGPETIDISVAEVDASYYYGVFNFNQGQPGVPPLIDTQPHVDVYNQNGLVYSFDPPFGGGDGNFWYVFWSDDIENDIFAVNCLAFYPAPFELLFSPPCP